MRVAFFLTGLLATSAAQADTARSHLDTVSKGLLSVTAQFKQSLTDANGKPGKSTEGKLALKAPRQFRWDVTAPYQQQIVADGMHVWVYDPDLEQVTVHNQGVEEAHSPLTVLTDLTQMDHDFASTEQGEHDGLVWLRLKPKAKDAEFEYADLGFDANGMARMQFKDSLGNSTDIRFSDWKRNAPVADATFHFVPPKGVDVIGEVKPEAETHPVKD
jgi:outer membrane lipoprotein carrier protein